MSTAAVSASSIYQQLEAYFQQRRSDAQQLGQDLKAGNLSAAQQDFNSIQTLGQSGPFANGVAFQNATREEDFTAIGQALQSGNISTAQQAFKELQSTFHHDRWIEAPQPGSGSSSTGGSGGSTTSSATQASPVGTPELILNLGNAPGNEQITIGLNNTGNGGEQKTVSVASQLNQAPEKFVFNLNQNSNEQIVLNLFNASASTPTQSNVSLTA